MVRGFLYRYFSAAISPFFYPKIQFDRWIMLDSLAVVIIVIVSLVTFFFVVVVVIVVTVTEGRTPSCDVGEKLFLFHR